MRMTPTTPGSLEGAELHSAPGGQVGRGSSSRLMRVLTTTEHSVRLDRSGKGDRVETDRGRLRHVSEIMEVEDFIHHKVGFDDGSA